MVHVRFDLSVPSWVVVCSLIRDSLSFCPFHFGGLSLSFLCLLSGFSFLLNLVGPSVCLGMFIKSQRLDDLVENTPSQSIMNSVLSPLFYHIQLSVCLFRLFVLIFSLFFFSGVPNERPGLFCVHVRLFYAFVSFYIGGGCLSCEFVCKWFV